jgi:AraC-like DNA-binding protein
MRPIQSARMGHAPVESTLLPLYGAGHEHRGSDYFHDAARRRDSPHLVIQLTLAGEGFYEDARSRHILSRGRAMIAMIPGPFQYGYNPGSRDAYEHAFVGISGLPGKLWHGRLVGAFGPVVAFDNAGPVESILLEFSHLREKHLLPDEYLLSAKLYQLMMTIFSTLRAARVTASPRVARAIQLMRDQGSDHRFTIELLAAQLDISREHLTREFTAAAGSSPSEFLQQHRLKLAARLLRTTDDKLESIARWSGFSGANYFVRLFKKTTGVTPAQFRHKRWMTL